MLSIGNNTSVGSNYTQQAKQQTETSMTVEQKILKYFLQPCCLPVAELISMSGIRNPPSD